MFYGLGGGWNTLQCNDAVNEESQLHLEIYRFIGLINFLWVVKGFVFAEENHTNFTVNRSGNKSGVASFGFINAFIMNKLLLTRRLFLFSGAINGKRRVHVPVIVSSLPDAFAFSQ